MGAWTDRIRLMNEGWSTDVRANNNGYSDPDKLSIGIWAKTWRWQDRVVEVNLHAHGVCSRSEDDPAPVLDRISALLLEACQRARREFLDSVPCQTHKLKDGRIELVSSSWETEHFLKSSPCAFPPDLLNIDPEAPETGAYAAGLREAMTLPGADYEDALNPYAEPRYARDANPREWQFQIRHHLRRVNGEIVKGANHKVSTLTTRVIEEGTAAGLVAVSAASMARRVEDYAPGGRRYGATPEGLPPGYEIYRIDPRPSYEDDDLEP
ncbi:MAG: hypothetical protein ABJN42_24915 [Roseibium sp.]|uniref:hypothetical protein n=1 Tax=Roseibium sp. TaxID=1936156 RepID=UPI0032986022